MILRKIQTIRDFSEVEKTIADYVAENGSDVCHMSIRELAQETYTSASAVTRFCKKIGVKGFPEFKLQLNAELKDKSRIDFDKDVNIPFQHEDSFDQIADSIARIGINGIEETKELFQYPQLERIVSKLLKCEVIDIYGQGSSLVSASEFKSKMLRLGKIVRIEPSAADQKYNAVNSGKKHCAIAISHSGENRSVREVVELLRKMKVPIIAITSDADSSIGREAMFTIETGAAENKYFGKKLEAYSSHMAVHFVLDCLYSFMYVRNYEENSFITKRNEKEIWGRDI